MNPEGELRTGCVQARRRAESLPHSIPITFQQGVITHAKFKPDGSHSYQRLPRSPASMQCLVVNHTYLADVLLPLGPMCDACEC